MKRTYLDFGAEDKQARRNKREFNRIDRQNRKYLEQQRRRERVIGEAMECLAN